MVIVPVVRLFLGPLARVPQQPRHWYDVIVWWELRRIPFNLIVGIVGMACVVLIIYVDTLPPPLPPKEADFDYFVATGMGAIVANFLYAVGWVCEIAVRSLPRQQIPWWLGPALFSGVLLLSLTLPVLGVADHTLWWLSRVVTGA
ncbi:MAG: hypothetical protein ABR978_03560 [Dehalococcoidia bacterium]